MNPTTIIKGDPVLNRQTDPGWYCARTKPKHEHLSAANLRKNLGLEVFHPRLRIERVTPRGIVRVNEPLFPCYLFVKCRINEKLNEIHYSVGIQKVVRFKDQIPAVSESLIEELRSCFEGEKPLVVEDRLAPGTKVRLGEGAFAGMSALVLQNLPSKQRVQVLLEILGRLTPMEIDRKWIALENFNLANRVPRLASHHFCGSPTA